VFDRFNLMMIALAIVFVSLLAVLTALEY